MPKYDEPLKVNQVVGRIGRDPETRETSAGDVTNFSVAQTREYGDGPGSTRWYRVAVWKEDLQDIVETNFQKGDFVVVEGTVKKTEYKGEDQWEMTAFRVGTVEYIVPDRKRNTDSRREEKDDDLDDI